MSKIKLYKNSERNNAEAHKTYVPQYQALNIKPEEIQNHSVPEFGVKKITPSSDNPRSSRTMIRQPYANIQPSPIGRGKGPVPNVGNNMEHSWSSVDGEIIDDVFNEIIEPDHEMIDNNEYVSSTALGLSEDSEMEFNLDVHEDMLEDSRDTVEEMSPKLFLTESDLKSAIKNQDDTHDALLSLKDEEYILFLDGIVLCSGSLNEVQEEVMKLAYGSHEGFDRPLSIDDMIVLKKVKIKVGIFLE